MHEAHIGDNYDLNPTVWSIFLVQHVKALRNGGWTAESAHIQELLSFETLYGWNKAKRSMFAIRVHNRTSGETNACATKIHGNLQIQKGWETVERLDGAGRGLSSIDQGILLQSLFCALEPPQRAAPAPGVLPQPPVPATAAAAVAPLVGFD